MDSKPKIDVIVVWPSGMDYPLWRWFIGKYRKLFREVIIVFYPHGSLDFTGFLYKNFLGVTFLISDTCNHRWREDAVNTALNRSKADWVWFTEQDFIVKDTYFFERVFEAMRRWDVIGTEQGNRFHPCCLFVKRSLIDRTSRDFSAPKKHFDHFSIFSREIKRLGRWTTLEKLGLKEGKDWFHLSSLTWNYFRVMDKEIKDFHEPKEFLVWNFYNRLCKVPKDPRWEALSYRAEILLTRLGKFLE